VPERLLTPRDRIAARVVTGPLAHFVAGSLDWFELAGRLAVARVRRSTRPSRRTGTRT
jgi:hypothetical protein